MIICNLTFGEMTYADRLSKMTLDDLTFGKMSFGNLTFAETLGNQCELATCESAIFPICEMPIIVAIFIHISLVGKFANSQFVNSHLIKTRLNENGNDISKQLQQLRPSWLAAHKYDCFERYHTYIKKRECYLCDPDDPLCATSILTIMRDLHFMVLTATCCSRFESNRNDAL